MINHEPIVALQTMLREQADPKSKAWWENYVKESAPFLGVKMPVIRKLLHRWHGQQIEGQLDATEQVDLALALFDLAYAEEKLAGTLFLQEILLPRGVLNCAQVIDRFAALFTESKIYDWNLCDWFCVKVLGPLIQAQGMECAERIAAWRDAENLWQARAALVAFVPVATERAYYPIIEETCRVLIRRQERFAKTAVGWILRDISQVHEPLVHRVLRKNLGYFSTESLRNATKYMDKGVQQLYAEMRKTL